MNYTPRQIAAFVRLAQQRKAGEAAEYLALHRLAAHAEAKDLKKQISVLEKAADGRS